MENSQFQRPKKVLIFNSSRVLIAIVRSLHSASELTGVNPQSISFSCTGRYVSAGGYYYRHVHPDVETKTEDLDELKLPEYDKRCGEKRRYHTLREMNRRHKRDALRKKAVKQNIPEKGHE